MSKDSMPEAFRIQELQEAARKLYLQGYKARKLQKLIRKTKVLSPQELVDAKRAHESRFDTQNESPSD